MLQLSELQTLNNGAIQRAALSNANSIASSTVLPRLRIELFQSLHQLLPEKRTESQHTLVRARSICPSLLVPAMTICEVALAIHFQATEDVLRPRDAAKIRRVPLVADVNIPASPCSSHASLAAGAASSVASCTAAAAVCLVRCATLALLLLREEDAARA